MEAVRGMGAFQWLEAAANVASIATATIAAFAGGWYLYQRRQKRLRLENYLKLVKEENTVPMDSGQRTPLQLMVALGLTEAEIVDLSFRSRRIRRVAGTMDPVMGLEYSRERSK